MPDLFRAFRTYPKAPYRTGRFFAHIPAPKNFGAGYLHLVHTGQGLGHDPLADFILELLELLVLLQLLSHVLIAFHKPFGVISQFTPDGSNHRTLADFDFPPAVYPIGRLDADSEGLLLLSDEARWTERILDPEIGHEREYWVQVEGVPNS